MPDQKRRRGNLPPAPPQAAYEHPPAAAAPALRQLHVETCRGRSELVVRESSSAGTATALFSFAGLVPREVNGHHGFNHVGIAFFDTRDPAARALRHRHYLKLTDPATGAYFTAPFLGSFTNPDQLHPSLAAAFDGRRNPRPLPAQLTNDQVALLQHLAASGVLTPPAVPQPPHGAPAPAVPQPFRGDPAQAVPQPLRVDHAPAAPQPVVAAGGDPAGELALGGEDDLLDEEPMQP